MMTESSGPKPDSPFPEVCTGRGKLFEFGAEGPAANPREEFDFVEQWLCGWNLEFWMRSEVGMENLASTAGKKGGGGGGELLAFG